MSADDVCELSMNTEDPIQHGYPPTSKIANEGIDQISSQECAEASTNADTSLSQAPIKCILNIGSRRLY